VGKKEQKRGQRDERGVNDGLQSKAKVVKTTGMIESKGNETIAPKIPISFHRDPSRVFPCAPPFSMRRGPTPRFISVFAHFINAITVIHLCARSDPISTGTGEQDIKRDSPEEARCAPCWLDGEAAHNQGVVPPHQGHRLGPGLGHPAPYRDGDGDMVGRNGGESAWRAGAPGADPWLVEEGAGAGRVRARHAVGLARVLCPLSCADRPMEESQIRHARG
jgi:hypothetical protein